LAVHQPNKLACGGARHAGKRAPVPVASLRPRWVRIFSMTSGSSMQAMILTLPAQLWQVSKSMLNTRFRRCAHWSGCPGVAKHMDVRERPSHRCPTLRRCGLLRIHRRGMLTSPISLRRRYPRTLPAVGVKFPVKACQVDPRLRHQGRQPGDEVQRLEDDVRASVALRSLQRIANISVWGER